MFTQCPKMGSTLLRRSSLIPFHNPHLAQSLLQHSRHGGGGCRRRLNLRPVAVFAGIVFGTQCGHQKRESVTRLPVGVWLCACESECECVETLYPQPVTDTCGNLPNFRAFRLLRPSTRRLFDWISQRWTEFRPGDQIECSFYIDNAF